MAHMPLYSDMGMLEHHREYSIPYRFLKKSELANMQWLDFSSLAKTLRESRSV